jgi:hypothetical protein
LLLNSFPSTIGLLLLQRLRKGSARQSAIASQIAIFTLIRA